MKNLFKHPYRVGTNQYKAKTKYRFWGSVAWLSAIILVTVIMGINAKQNQVVVNAAELIYITPTPTPKPEEMTEKEKIVAYIKEVFGKDADRAFKLLECENRSLNPNAINTAGNTPAGSRDIGIFQINEYWQGVNGKFLFDPKINVQIAYKIFKDSGYSFKMWTCDKPRN
ncbi:MAG: hypothetical protein U1E54_04735 [Candidatus Levybacteria bacterium]|nr:hypothetical protein [Candidatus Levybacteria bacterium]